MSDDEASAPEKGDRIAKVLARAGLCSRRDAERWIEDGRVWVDGKKLLTPAFVVTPGSIILVDGKPLKEPEPSKLWRYHKPAGLVTSHRDEKGRETLFDTLPPEMGRVISVGRLDLNSEGPAAADQRRRAGAQAGAAVEPAGSRRYKVRVHGTVEPERFLALTDGVVIDGVRYGQDRGRFRAPEGLERLGHGGIDRRQEPRDPQGVRASGLCRDPALAPVLRPVPTGSAAARRDRGSAAPAAAARPAGPGSRQGQGRDRRRAPDPGLEGRAGRTQGQGPDLPKPHRAVEPAPKRGRPPAPSSERSAERSIEARACARQNRHQGFGHDQSGRRRAPSGRRRAAAMRRRSREAPAMRIVGGNHRGRPIVGPRGRQGPADQRPGARIFVQHPGARPLGRRRLADRGRARAGRVRRNRCLGPGSPVARRRACDLPWNWRRWHSRPSRSMSPAPERGCQGHHPARRRRRPGTGVRSPARWCSWTRPTARTSRRRP